MAICLVLGDPVTNTFVINITPEMYETKQISHIRGLVCRCNVNSFAGIDEKKNKFVEEIDIVKELEGVFLPPDEMIREHLDKQLASGHIHIIVDPTEHIKKKRRLWYKDPNEIDIIQDLSNVARQVPVSQSEFKLVRENNLLYVDKTSWLAELNLNFGQYIVSRPRKFGKSMFLSMVESFFLVQHDLFKDLYVYEHPPEIYVKGTVRKWNESDLPPIPVIRLDFSKLTSNKGAEVLEEELIQALNTIGESYDITLELGTVKSTTEDLIKKLANHEENAYEKVVILVDEYDSPIISVFDTTKESLKIAVENREILDGFFEIIKALQQKIKFCLVTGVTIQLFSRANQLFDLTLSDKLSGAYGFTNNEIETTFKSKFSGEYLNVSAMMNKLKKKYYGYSWNGNIRVYNPFSICSFFYENKLENFLIKKGRTSFLAKLVRLEHIKDISKHEIRINRDYIVPVSIESIQNSLDLPVSLFFQTGYLTIKRVDRVNEKTYLIFEIPNNEVRDSLIGELWANSFYTPVEKVFRRIEILVALLKKDDLIAFLKEFNNDLASIPYNESQHAGKYEGYYHSHIHMLVRYIGLPFRSEDATSEGRTDMWIETKNIIYYFEFKRYDLSNKNKNNQVIARLINEAIDQIFETKYYSGHTNPESYNKMRYAIGCVYSTKTQKICGVGTQKFTYGSNGLEKMELQKFLNEFS